MKKIVVIGGGPGGYPAALKAASLGAEVTLVEKNKLGGVCLNCGCIPSKALLDVAHKIEGFVSLSNLVKDDFLFQFANIKNNFDWNKIKARQEQATRKLSQGIQFLLKQAKVNVIVGEAKLIDNHTICITTVNEQQMINCDGIILATGSKAFIPAPFDKIQDKIYDNSTFFGISELPKSLVIVGGGVIGCEMADLMNALGVEVHLLEMQSHILPQENDYTANQLVQEFSKRGIQIHTQVTTSTVTHSNGMFTLSLSDGKSIEAQSILVAVGRTVDLTNLGLENISVEWNRKGVAVNPATLQLKENIYAVGDMNGLLQLAHAATRQGEIAAENLCGGKKALYNNEIIPRVIYTSPEIASVGCTELVEGGKSRKAFFLANGRAVAQYQTKGFVEIFSDAEDKLIGATIMGPQATELIHIVAVALKAKLSVAELKEVVFSHPSFSEIVTEALCK